MGSMFQRILEVATPGAGLHDIGKQVAAAVAESGVRVGVCHVFVQHTSASLLIQENADPAVRRDLEAWLADLAPEDRVMHFMGRPDNTRHLVVANGDMVTLTLIQGVVNTFVMFLARVIGYFIDNMLSGRGQNDERSSSVGFGYYITVFVLEIVFGILASMIVAWFSRQREFRADRGGAHLAGKRKMISALQKLGGGVASTLPPQQMAFGIAGGVKEWFSTHPPIEKRIAALQAATN